ncbi:MAG: hypothetical protein COB85_05775 [Bacteroidetes bacterium]|nr:MAG: hypothetical protein COB85_05775 [Bacteroidota bacterium]
MSKKAIIVGHTGQDGTYLFQLLKRKNYKILGISSTSTVMSDGDTYDVVNIQNNLEVEKVVASFQPDEIYYLAATHQSSGDKQIDEGELFQRSIDINVKSLVNFLEAIRNHKSNAKLFYAASSHLFGNPENEQQDESTPINPDCIYGITKAAGVKACQFYWENHGVFASVGIFYNHESPLRQSKYVSKKIVETAVAIKNNKANELQLGSLDSRIDWGYAPDYVEAVFRIIQLDLSDIYVISSGSIHSVEDFVEKVFSYLGMNWKDYVKISKDIITKKQKRNLFGNSQKLMIDTDWTPTHNFDEMIKILVEEELKKG